MATETLRPTASAESDPTVSNPTQAYDGNAGTYAEIYENSAGSSAGFRMYTFPAEAINGAARTTSNLVIKAHSTTTDAGVSHAVFISVDDGSTWNLVDAVAGSTSWGTGPTPTTRTFDISSYVGSIQATKVRVAIRVDNNVASPPTFPT